MEKNLIKLKVNWIEILTVPNSAFCFLLCAKATSECKPF